MPWDHGLGDNRSPIDELRRTGSLETARERLRNVAPPIMAVKARSLIEMRDPDGALGYVERKLINALVAWRRDRPDENAGAWTVAATARLREAIGQAGQDGNRRLRAALTRLTEVPVVLDTESAGRAETPLLADYDLPAGAGLLAFRLSDVVLPDVDKPFPFAKLDMRICNALGSKYGLVLYELAALLENRNFPSATLSLADVGARFGSGRRYPGAAALKSQVVDRAIASVCAHTPLHVTPIWQKGYRKRETAVRLEVAKAG